MNDTLDQRDRRTQSINGLAVIRLQASDSSRPNHICPSPPFGNARTRAAMLTSPSFITMAQTGAWREIHLALRHRHWVLCGFAITFILTRRNLWLSTRT